MKIDSGLGAELSKVADRVRTAEAAGLDCLWAAETTNDPFLSLTLAAEHSTTVSLGTGVAIAFARNPMSLAYTTNQLQEYSDGRVVLGLGSQVRRHIEKRFSSTWSHPAARMREYVLALRAIWASWNDGSCVGVRGRLLHAHLDDPGLRAPPACVRPAPGLPRRGRAAHERGGGRGGRRCHHPRHLAPLATCARSSLPALDRGLAKSGRTRDDVRGDVPGLHLGGRGRVGDGEGP